ncbi:MAG: hypothetical protein ACXWQO_19900 [Bdellovibrionota bacterium]
MKYKLSLLHIVLSGLMLAQFFIVKKSIAADETYDEFCKESKETAAACEKKRLRDELLKKVEDKKYDLLQEEKSWKKYEAEFHAETKAPLTQYLKNGGNAFAALGAAEDTERALVNYLKKKISLSDGNIKVVEQGSIQIKKDIEDEDKSQAVIGKMFKKKVDPDDSPEFVALVSDLYRLNSQVYEERGPRLKAAEKEYAELQDKMKIQVKGWQESLLCYQEALADLGQRKAKAEKEKDPAKLRALVAGPKENSATNPAKKSCLVSAGPS